MNQKLVIYLLFTFLVAGWSSLALAVPKEKHTWSLSIAIPVSNGVRVIDSNSTQPFHVVLTNISKTDQKIWKQTNSWGYSVLSFILIDKQGVKKTIRKRQRGWRKNNPSFYLINSGEQIVYDVLLTGKEWQGFMTKTKSVQHVKLQAVIEIPEDDKTREFGIWTGLIKSEVYDVKILD